MKAPNKIFIWNIGGVLSARWKKEQKNPTHDIEYIRKDALLDWIKENHQMSVGVTWSALKDKINTL